MTRLMAAALPAAVLAGLPAATLARQSDESDEARRVREASVVFGEIMTAPAAPPGPRLGAGAGAPRKGAPPVVNLKMARRKRTFWPLEKGPPESGGGRRDVAGWSAATGGHVASVAE